MRFKFLQMLLVFLPLSLAIAADDPQKDFIHPMYEKHKPKVIAVLPMDNISLEQDTEVFLYDEVYNNVQSKGYVRISTAAVMEKMRKFGIQTPGQIAAISPQTLGKELNCDAILIGQIEQSGSIHTGLYDAAVVSCSLALRSCATGEVLWHCAQWRAAHRQWQLDPINALINFAYHQKASRKDRVAWLVQEMLKTLPRGPVNVVKDDFLNKATEIKAD